MQTSQSGKAGCGGTGRLKKLGRVEGCSADAIAENRGRPGLGGRSVQETEPRGFTLRGCRLDLHGGVRAHSHWKCSLLIN